MAGCPPSPPSAWPHAYRTSTLAPCAPRHFRKHASGPSAAYASNAPFSLSPHSAPLAKAQLTDVCTYCQILSSLLVNRRPPDTSPRDAPHATVWSPLPLTPVASNPKSFKPTPVSGHERDPCRWCSSHCATRKVLRRQDRAARRATLRELEAECREACSLGICVRGGAVCSVPRRQPLAGREAQRRSRTKGITHTSFPEVLPVAGRGTVPGPSMPGRATGALGASFLGEDNVS